VYVAPSKPAVSDDLPPGEDRRMWSSTASTLIHGVRDARCPPQIPNDIMSLIGQRSRCPVARNLAMSSSAVCID
jgi:hypothetical protein